MSQYQFATVKRPENKAGRPSSKLDFIIVGRIRDLDKFTRDKNGVDIIEFSHKPNTRPIGIYQITSTAKIYDEPAGDQHLSSGYIHHVEMEFPGTEREITIFRENNTGVELYAIQVYLGTSTSCKIAGYPGNALFLKANSQDDKDADKTMLKFDQLYHGNSLGFVEKPLVLACISLMFSDEVEADPKFFQYGISATREVDGVAWQSVYCDDPGAYFIATPVVDGFNYLAITVPQGSSLIIRDEMDADITASFHKIGTVTVSEGVTNDLYMIDNTFYTGVSTSLKIIIS